jgi:hypothetical protein
MRKKQEQTIPMDLGDGQESYLVVDTTFVGRFTAKKFHKWINVQGYLDPIEKNLVTITASIEKDKRLQNICEKLGDEAGLMLLLLEQSPKEGLHFDHIFVDMDIEELKEILEMDELQLKSAMLTLIEHGILKVDKNRNKGKYRIDHGWYQQVAYPCVLKGGNETVIIRSLHNE